VPHSRQSARVIAGGNDQNNRYLAIFPKKLTDVTGVFVPTGVRENSLWREAGMPMKKYKPEQIDHQVVAKAILGGLHHEYRLERHAA